MVDQELARRSAAPVGRLALILLVSAPCVSVGVATAVTMFSGAGTSSRSDSEIGFDLQFTLTVATFATGSVALFAAIVASIVLAATSVISGVATSLRAQIIALVFSVGGASLCAQAALIMLPLSGFVVIAGLVTIVCGMSGAVALSARERKKPAAARSGLRVL